MADLFDVVAPRDDVLAGELTDAVFAASLDEVVAGTAPDAYGRPDVFFAATYPSAGLRSLLEEALGRVGGGRRAAAPVIRIETNLGGGKTHNLIALWHAARGDLDRMRAMEFMDPGLLPDAPVPQLAVFVGTAAGATSFPAVDGVAPNTVWGYLALQLGGRAAYERVRADDEALTAPGADALKQILGDRPSLILIDEIARYLAVAEGRPVAKSTLGAQTIAFLMALLEAVAAQAQAVVVITTTQVTDAFGEQTGQVLQAISDAQALIARKEHVLRPSEEADLPKILTRRLFARVDPGAAAAAAAEYATAASDAYSRGADLPERMTGPAWVAEVEASFPFHPALVSVLDKRLSTIPNFQRTRGALRLLARTIRRLWDAKPAGTGLIHVHHVDLGDGDTVEDLSSRLDRATFEPVIRTDIASQAGAEPAHAEQVDERMGGVPYTRRLATTAYLYSLTREVPGVPASALLGAVLAPGDDPNVITKALDNLEGVAWYLHTDARGYRFSTEASLPRLIQEAESQITPTKVRQAATDILAGLFRDSALKVRRSWEDAKVPDRDDDAWLVVLHWDEFGGEYGIRDLDAVPAQVTSLWERTPAGGVREYRNRLVFLVPTASGHDQMIRTVRQSLALHDIVASPDTMRSLTEEKRKEAAERAKSSEMEARVAVCNHANVLYIPESGGLDAVELDVVTQASLLRNQTDAVLNRLGAMEKTLVAGDKPLDPAWIRSKLGAQLDKPMTTAELVRVFARRSDMKLVLDRAQLVTLVTAGIRNGVWEYHDAERGDDGWATADRPPTGGVRLADDTLLYPTGSAPEREAAGGGAPLLAPPPAKRPAGEEFNAEGKADVALTDARQAAADAGRTTLRAARIAVDVLGEATATELAKLLSLVPPGTAGVDVVYEVDVRAELDGDGHGLEVSFRGAAADYQPLKAAIDHVLRNHPAALQAAVVANFEPAAALSGEVVDDIRRRAGDTGPSRCQVTFTTEASA